MIKIREKTQNNIFLKLIIIIASLGLPLIFVLSRLDILDSENVFFFDYLWIGFYSTLFAFLFLKKNMVIKTLMVINIIIILFGLISSLLAGLPGLIYMTLRMIFPFIPKAWIEI